MKRLRQIAPVWASRIKEGKVKNHLEELGDYNRCIVGEAWRYSDEYLGFCDVCHTHAFWLTNFQNIGRFNETIKSFEQHFNKEHLAN